MIQQHTLPLCSAACVTRCVCALRSDGGVGCIDVDVFGSNRVVQS